jgi:hypothetical protein
MGCAYFKTHKIRKSKQFEMDAVRAGTEARGIGWDKVCKQFPQVTKANGHPDYMTQIEIAGYLNFPLAFFYQKFIPSNNKGIVCGSGIVACAFCGMAADFYCDYPVGKGRTCDLPLCKDHKKHKSDIGADIDYCPHHY